MISCLYSSSGQIDHQPMPYVYSTHRPITTSTAPSLIHHTERQQKVPTKFDHKEIGYYTDVNDSDNSSESSSSEEQDVPARPTKLPRPPSKNGAAAEPIHKKHYAFANHDEEPVDRRPLHVPHTETTTIRPTTRTTRPTTTTATTSTTTTTTTTEVPLHYIHGQYDFDCDGYEHEVDADDAEPILLIDSNGVFQLHRPLKNKNKPVPERGSSAAVSATKKKTLYYDHAETGATNGDKASAAVHFDASKYEYDIRRRQNTQPSLYNGLPIIPWERASYVTIMYKALKMTIFI